MTIYGEHPGVVAEVVGGGLASIAVGRAQKLVVFGRGDPQNGTADVNSVEEINTRLDADDKFGTNTELADGIRKALQAGANIDYLYGVMPEPVTVTGESVTGDNGALSNGPIVEDISTINVIDDTDSTDENISFVYEQTPEVPSEAGVNINPLTGAFEADDSNSYTVDYEYLDWSSAFDAADTTLIHNEVGVYAPLSEANSVANTLADKLDELRPTFKLIRGVMGAEPNKTGSEGQALIDPQNYSDTVDRDSMFLLGPVREQDGYTAIGSAAGVFSGHELTNPVYGDRLAGVSALNQTLTKQQEGELRNAQVIPVQDNAGDGAAGVRMEDNISTSTQTDWPRDFHRRRIVDQVLLVGHAIGEEIRDRRLIDDTLLVAEEEFKAEIENFIEAGLLRGNLDENAQTTQTEDGQQEQDDQEDNLYFVEATRSGTDAVNISVGITPTGVIKRVDEVITVNTGGGDLSSDNTSN